MRASAGELAEVHGWWRAGLLVLHATDADPGVAQGDVAVASEVLPVTELLRRVG